MYAGDPDELRAWTARHGSALRSLVSAHADFVDAVSGARSPAERAPAPEPRLAATAARLLEASRAVAALPPVPDPHAQDLIDRLLYELRATVDAGTTDLAALRASALRSSLVVVDLVDRLLQPG
jgi:hypothetical protein